LDPYLLWNGRYQLQYEYHHYDNNNKYKTGRVMMAHEMSNNGTSENPIARSIVNTQFLAMPKATHSMPSTIGWRQEISSTGSKL
jgi:hypothetical protein